jgi:putative peptide zinc metalloprotease protein
MPEVMTIPPARRRDLILSQVSDCGKCVVKDPHSGSYYDLGPEEAFLLEQLDGERPSHDICKAFGDRFGEALEADDLGEFVELARSKGFLRSPKETTALTDGSNVEQKDSSVQIPSETESGPTPAKKMSFGRFAGKMLYWRTNFFDPDRFFNWLEPRIRFVWTRGFVAATAGMIALALILLIGNFRELVHLLPRALHWETLVLAWLVLGAVTFLHEFAHGLTCKHYGGEVREVGFLLMFFMPCFYCNVSDAWLFREKRKRLLVMLAGGYCDLILWSLAVFVWRLTHTQTIIHYIACLVLSICGGRVLINFNPLMRLDGYYLLSDWAEIPNLRKRSWAYVMGHVRSWLWGAPLPEAEERGKFMFLYGALSWTFAIVYVGLFMLALVKLGGVRLGVFGIILAGAFAIFVLRNLLSGIGGGEIMKMFLQRHKRATVWGSVLLGIPAILLAVQSEEKAGGAFQIRSVTRAELRAQVSGFLEKVNFDEGDPVTKSDVIARLQVPDLGSRIAQKSAEVNEVTEQLNQLKSGTRSEEKDEQQKRVKRAEDWCTLAKADLARARSALQDELRELDQQITQFRTERDFARDSLAAEERLYEKKVVPLEDYLQYRKKYEVAESQFDQAISKKKAREATGVQVFEAELARRQKDLADAEAALNLMVAGTRKETIAAEESKLERLTVELTYLKSLKDKLEIRPPVAGVIILPRGHMAGASQADTFGNKLRERVGQYFHEGDLICVIEDPSNLEVDIAVDEQEAGHVEKGQQVDLKVRALPFSTFKGSVVHIAPNAVPGEVQSTIHVYCHLENEAGDLKSGMSGHARIHGGKRPLGINLIEKGLRFLRTEVWW